MSYREACLISSSGKRSIAMVILHRISGTTQMCLVVVDHTTLIVTMVEAVVEMVVEKMFEGGGDSVCKCCNAWWILKNWCNSSTQNLKLLEF